MEQENSATEDSKVFPQNQVDLPCEIANFKGSFVRNGLGSQHQAKIFPANKGKVAQWNAYFLDGWDCPGLYKGAFIEFIAATLLIYTSGLIDVTLANFDTVIIAPFVGVSNIVLLSLFIMATGPGSGGHINQTITFATLLTGFTGFSRAILYMTAQTAGAALAGGILRGAFGHTRIEKYHGGGCFINPNTVSSGQALLIEVVSSFTLLFLSFGVGLDPRQARLFGACIGPVAVGCVLGLVSFASAGIVPGYTGAAMFPGRCFAFAIARGNFSNQWIWWVGPIGGSVLQAFTYWVAPPYHSAPVPIAAREQKEPMA